MDWPYQVTLARARNRTMKQPARLRPVAAMLLGLLLGLPCVGAALAACNGTIIAATDCHTIPEGGCPERSDVDPCADATCFTTYTCVARSTSNNEGTWRESRTCPPKPVPDLDASVADASVIDASDAEARDANAVPTDLPPGATGGPGCVDLEYPDCPLAVGYGCQTACCGCEELFVCNAGGWDPWGDCENDTPTAY